MLRDFSVKTVALQIREKEERMSEEDDSQNCTTLYFMKITIQKVCNSLVIN